MMDSIKIPDYIILQDAQAPPDQMPYGIRMIGAPLEWPETRGEGIKVAVIDTGRPDHPDINVVGAVDFTGSGVIDRRGHGTHCAGTIAANGKLLGVAPGVELYTVKVFPDSGGTDPAVIAKALDWCVSAGIDIASMSLSGPAENVDLRNAVKRAYAAGIVMVAAAGNYGRDWGVMYPAKYPEVLAVAAVDTAKAAADFSAYGAELDIAAAGVRVWSTWLGGKYVELDGTSMACPHIAGAAAILQAKAKRRLGRKLAPEEMRVALNLYAEDLGAPGRDERYGCGVFSFGRFGSSDTIQREIKMWIGRNEYMVNGQQKTMDVAPFIREGRTFTPARYVAEGLGAEVGWDEQEQLVTIKWPGVVK
jgi:subtilisin